MGKALMVLVAGFVVASAFYNSGRTDSIVDSSSRVSDHQYEILAREAALKGYERAKQSLSTSFTNGQVSGSYEGGSYMTTIAVNGTSAAVTSVGTLPGSDGQGISYTVRGEYEQEFLLPENPPGFMDYALMTEDDLILNGNILGDVIITGDEASFLNANMHTNGDLTIMGNSVDVKGFGTYAGFGSASPNRALTGSFRPSFNPTNLASAHHADHVNLPTFDMAAYLTEMTPDRSDVGAAMTGTHELGTRENPYVWYVDGNLTTVGNTNFTGYGVFLVNGNIELTGNVIAGESGYTGPDESSLAFYASGDITLGGNSTIYGQMYANGNLILQGTPQIYGSLTAAGSAILSGTPTIYYRRASPGLTEIWQDPIILSKLSAYSEF